MNVQPKNDAGKTLCFTGHRTIPANHMEKLIKALDMLIEKSYEEGYRNFIAGGALGFDTVAAFRVLGARDKHKDIRLILALPCRNQTENWTSIQSIREYQILKDNADEVIYLQTFYDKDCMLKRNRYMVDRSSRCISYLTRMRGGSAYTVNYAVKKGLEHVNSAEFL